MHLKISDPFAHVDCSPGPTAEEAILIDRFHGQYYQDILNWFFRFATKDLAPKAVLEVGCGTGHLLHKVCEYFPNRPENVSGVDLSTFLIRNASNRFPDFQFKVADGKNLPFETDTFDLVFIATVLVHAPQQRAILREMVRVTRPGGCVAVLDQDFETAVLFPGERALTRRVLNAAADFWEDGWIGRKLPAYMHSAGLRDVAIDAKVRIDRKYDSGFFKRISNWIVTKGFPEDLANQWYENLERATPEDFLFSRNFYAATGLKPRT